MKKASYLFVFTLLVQTQIFSQKNKSIDFLRRYQFDSSIYLLEDDDKKNLGWQINFLSHLNIYDTSLVNIPSLESHSSNLTNEFYFLINQGDFLFYSRNDKNLESRNFYLKAFELVERTNSKVLKCEVIKKILNINRYRFLQDNTTSSYYLELYESNAYDQLEIAYLNYYRLILSFQHYKADKWNKIVAGKLLEFTKNSQSNSHLNALIYQLHASYKDLLGDYDKAIEFELKALKQIEKVEYEYATTLLKVSQINLIRYYIYNSQIDLARDLLMNFNKEPRNSLESDFVKYIYFYQSVIDSTDTNFKGAFNNLFEYVKKTELATQTNNQNLLKELEAKYKAEKKENEILQQKNQINNQNKLLIAISGFFMIAIGLTIGLVLSYRKIRHKNKKIQTLMRELHHRVKNNLQVVSSLLGLQSMKLQDPVARKAVTEGKDRLRAMSLIHQKLYQDEDKIGLNIKEYLSNLVTELAQSYGYQNKTKFVLDIPSIELDADNTLPLGLIVNELVSNSFKYAFHDVSNPELEIKLFQENEKEFSFLFRDNGPGFPNSFDITKSNSFGTKLVSILVKQLNGTMETSHENGLTYRINFRFR